MKTKKASKRMTARPAEYLKRPYGRVVFPEVDGTFRAEIIEFPGCIAVGETAAEALTNLENVATSWLESVLAKGQHVPEPIEATDCSGKLLVRLPRSLHKKAAHMAARDGVSLNQYIAASVAEQVGSDGASKPMSFVVQGSWSFFKIGREAASKPQVLNPDTSPFQLVSTALISHG